MNDVDARWRHTDEEDERAGHDAAEDGEKQTLGRHVLVVEVAKHRHAEPLEDVVDVEETRQHLREVAEHVLPAYVRSPKQNIIIAI